MKALAAALLALAFAPAGASTQAEPGLQSNLRALCGKSFEGRVVKNEPRPATPDPFETERLVIQVRCEGDGVQIPLAVGEDRSRTWLITFPDDRVRLEHEHRHADGTLDAVTDYGGTSVKAGTRTREEFPADEATRALFLREGLPASVDNTWALEVEPGRALAYELTRPGGRHFRVEFDLARPLAQ